MGFVPNIVCRNCRRPYSGLLKKCPHCGARRQTESNRAAAGTDSVQKGTAASARAATNNVWQLAFGLILLAVVMLSVIVLITTSLSGREEIKDPSSGSIATPPPVVSPAVSESPAVASPEPVNTPAAQQPTSLGVFYNTTPLDSGFTHIIDGEPLSITATVYPIDQQFKVEWRSTDEQVFTVTSTDDSGMTASVKGVGEGRATLIVSCNGIDKELPVIIKQHW